MLMTDLMHSKNHQHNEKSRQHNDSVTNILNRSPSEIHQHNVVTNITVTNLRLRTDATIKINNLTDEIFCNIIHSYVIISKAWKNIRHFDFFVDDFSLNTFVYLLRSIATSDLTLEQNSGV